MTKASKNKRTAYILIAIVIGMFGFGFALVPLYNVLCNVTGINGRYSNGQQTATNNIDRSRMITVNFMATNNAQLPWQFHPVTSTLKIHPGEVKRIDYYAKNKTSSAMMVQAIPSIAPGEAAQYLKKTECFCFTQQSLQAGEAVTMPVFFYVDPDLPKEIATISLSYTLFDVSKPKKQTSRSDHVS